MEQKTLLEMGYRLYLTQFTDTIDGGMNRLRRKIDIVPTFAYKTPTSVWDERNVHLAWYSSPDPVEYDKWTFVQLTIAARHTDILNDPIAQPLLLAIATMADNLQPQDFEKILQTLGFSRRS
jgi:hypothetical protein